MKRYLLPLLICLFLMFSAVHTGYAIPAGQDSTAGSDASDVFGAIGVFSQFISAGLDAAGTQIGTMDPSEISEPDAEPLPADPGNIDPEGWAETEPKPETAVISGPAEPEIPEEPPFSPVPEYTAPDDPENVAVSMGIDVSDFYNRFKKNLKALGVHSISFEEKAGKNTSRIDADGNISIQMHYEKTRYGNLIDRLVFKAVFEGWKQQNNTETVFNTVTATLCGDLDINYSDTGDIFNAVLEGESGAAAGLLYYGTAETVDGITTLSVKIYYAGD